ncbi:MAG: four-helix bundle copper-binding protein [Bacteroidota bacterium]|nr:four-helix bundle copper-binding protein [Bacteroidota bacterium]
MTKTHKSIELCIKCLLSCEKCITHCISAENFNCIQLCRDCADLCALCIRMEARNSNYTKKLMALCVEVCKVCSVECNKNLAHHPTCMDCSVACLKCAEACEEFILDQATNSISSIA